MRQTLLFPPVNPAHFSTLVEGWNGEGWRGGGLERWERAGEEGCRGRGVERQKGGGLEGWRGLSFTSDHLT